MAHISFIAVLNNGGIGKALEAFGKALRKIIFTFCNLPKTIVL